jgi:hypothetical protein
MNASNHPPPPEDLPDPDGDMPRSVGVATMSEDGTLRLKLRTVGPRGEIGEALMVVKPGEARYASMRAHLAGLAPGGSIAIPPFPPKAIDPDSV